MSTAEQKNDEQRFLRYFLELAIQQFGISASACPLDPPNPDFGLTMADGCTVGLEITELVRSEIGIQGAAIERLRSQLKEELVQRGLNCMVRLSFEKPFDTPTTQQIRRVVPKIADWVALGGGDEREIRDTDSNAAGATWSNTFGIVGLRQVAVRPHAEPLVCIDRTVDGRDLPTFTVALDRKTSRLAKYKAAGNFSAVWLLLVAGTALADPYLDYADYYEALATGFDRVFWLEVPPRRELLLRELNMQKRPSST